MQRETQCLWQNQGCKGALAQKKPFLSKRPKPKPTNSAYAEFGYRLPISKARTGVQSQNSACAEFWSFGTGRLHKAGRFRCQNASPLKFDYFWKSRFCLALPKRPKRVTAQSGRGGSRSSRAGCRGSSCPGSRRDSSK